MVETTEPRDDEVARIAAVLPPGNLTRTFGATALEAAQALYDAGLRSTSRDSDLGLLLALIGDRDIYVQSPEGVATRIRFGRGEPDVPLDSRTGMPLGHGQFATSESLGDFIERLTRIAPGMVTIHEGRPR